MHHAQHEPPAGFRAIVGDYLVAFYQTQRNAFVIIVTLLLAAYVLTVPDQAVDMIEAVSDAGILNPLFGFIVLTAFIWSWVVYGSTRLILHIAPVGLRLNYATDQLLRWLPRLGGMLPMLILAAAFWQPSRLQPYLLGLGSVGMLVLFRQAERNLSVFCLPARWTFRDRYTSLRQDIRVLWRHPLGRWVVAKGLVLTVVLLVLFSLPVEWGVARQLRPTAVVILGIAFFTFWGGLLAYFNDYRYRPLMLGVGTYLVLVSAVNDNTDVRRATAPDVPALNRRPTVEQHLAGWLRARQPVPGDTIPLILVAAEGGGTRALNWTAETLIRLDSIIPGFSRHVYALSGVSGGGVGVAFYTAFLRDVPGAGRIRRFTDFRRVIRDDYLSAVTATLLFPESIQRLLPVAIPALERAKWLEDAWADSYRTNLGLPTFDQSLTSLYQRPDGSYNYELPSLLLNGTLAESGQKVITSNLRLDPRYFRDVVPTLDVLGSDVPIKTAASLCSRFPIVTNGARIRRDSLVRGQTVPFGGHIVDGGYFDNSGVETCFQLLNNLVPTIRRLSTTERIVVQPYILFIQNSSTLGKLPRSRSILQIIRVPLLGFFNAWDNGSVTRDNMFNSFVDRFADPKTNYLTLRLAYNDRYPLGWYLSDRVASRLSEQAHDSISLSNPELARLSRAFRRVRNR